MQNILSLLQKIYDTNNAPGKSMIEIDIMMDYTRLLYEELSFEKQRLIAQKTPPNFYNIWNSADNNAATVATQDDKPAAEQPVIATAATPATDETTPVIQHNVVLPVPVEAEITQPVPVADIVATPVQQESTFVETEIKQEEYTTVIPVVDQQPVLPEVAVAEDTVHYQEEYEDVTAEPEVVYNDGGADQFNDLEPEVKEDVVETEAHITDEVVFTELTVAPAVEDDAENSWEIEEELRTEETVAPTASAPVYQPPVQTYTSFYQPAKRTHQDIRSLIGINDKYQVMSELFGNSKEAYEAALNEMNKKDDYKQAVAWLDDNHPQIEKDGYSFHLFEGIMHRFYND